MQSYVQWWATEESNSKHTFFITNNHQINNGNVARNIAIHSSCSYISMMLQWQFSIIISNGFVDLFTPGDHVAWNHLR